jgi:hypothetical protein
MNIVICLKGNLKRISIKLIETILYFPSLSSGRTAGHRIFGVNGKTQIQIIASTCIQPMGLCKFVCYFPVEELFFISETSPVAKDVHTTDFLHSLRCH